MIWCKCINKIRDKNGIITDYEIASISGERRIVSKDQLKTAMINNQVALVNLKLSKDGKMTNRSIEEEAELTKKLTTNNLSETEAEKVIAKEKNLTLKANMLGTAVTVDKYGSVTSIPNTQIVIITPDVRYITYNVNYSDFKDKTVVFSGSEKVILDIGALNKANIVEIKNSAMVESVYKNLIHSKKILLNYDNIDIKTIDIIFKTYKTDLDTNSYYSDAGEFTTIIIKSSKLDKDIATDRVRKVLLRQKPSSISDRRAYDLIVYLRLIKTLYESYGEYSLPDLTREYINELRSIFNSSSNGISQKHHMYLRTENKFIEKLIDEMESTL